MADSLVSHAEKLSVAIKRVKNAVGAVVAFHSVHAIQSTLPVAFSPSQIKDWQTFATSR